MPQSIVVHNLEDAQVYLLLGFHVVMPMRLVGRLHGMDRVVHAENTWGASSEAMMNVWLGREKPKERQ